MIVYGPLLLGRLCGAPHLLLQHGELSVAPGSQHLALDQSLLQLLYFSATLQSGYLRPGNTLCGG